MLQSPAQVRRYAATLVIVTLLGFALRIHLIDQFPLRADEAIYSFWALHFWRADPFFLTVWPDKPPLFIWLLSVGLHWFGDSQAAARWLNIALSTLTIPVVAVIAHRWWGRWTAVLAALIFSLNPFAISFAPTVYTDPLLVLAGTFALYLALQGRCFWAGFW
ncbi:MAG: glycosyltransferase family 39 protein, partial [Chloroflexota bacterium]|nr:glycosyltransferase family 39 protein [Chloroflexota bacterium]